MKLGIDNEDFEAVLREAEGIAIMAGFANFREMEQFRFEAHQGMINFGGSFSKSLGHTLARADMKNAAKIIQVFRDVCHEHAELWRKFSTKKALEIEHGKDLG